MIEPRQLQNQSQVAGVMESEMLEKTSKQNIQQETIDQLKERIYNLDKENRSLMGDMGKMKSENDSLKYQVDSLQAKKNSEADSLRYQLEMLQSKNTNQESNLGEALKPKPPSNQETYYREKSLQFDSEMNNLRYEHTKTSQEQLDLKTVNDLNNARLQNQLIQIHNGEKRIAALEGYQIHNFLLAVEVERIRKLYLELENEYFTLQADMEKMDTQLKNKALPIINEEEDVQQDNLMIKSFLQALENTRLRFLYNEVVKEKAQITELMEEMHSIVNEQSKSHSVSSPLNRSFDKKHLSNINNMMRKDGAPSTMVPDNARADVNQILERYQK